MPKSVVPAAAAAYTMTSTPAIRISHHHHRYSNSPSPYSSCTVAAPMAIPGAEEPVPPPLPPPTYIPEIASGHDPGWHWANNPKDSDYARPASVKPGSSLLGGGSFRGFLPEKERDVNAHGTQHAVRGTMRRDNDMTDDGLTPSDEDRPPSSYRLQSERQLEQRTLEESAVTYDKHLLSRIGGPNAPKRLSVSSTGPDPTQLPHGLTEHNNSTLRPLTLPERRHTSSLSIDSPSSSRWPGSSAVSPGSTAMWPEPGVHESRHATPSRHNSLAFDDSIAHRESVEQSMFLNEELMEDAPMGNLNINDRSPTRSDDPSSRAGTKRRAPSSPHDTEREDRSSTSGTSGPSDLYHRRSMQHLLSRESLVSHFYPANSSVSSASSLRHGSLTSSLGVGSMASSATSYASGRLSPGAASPANLDPALQARPFPTNPAHSRALSENTHHSPLRRPSTDNAAHLRTSSLTQMAGGYTCECCPKKPRKFDTQDELRLHEAEKAYTCAYCSNRFKNKNEAERHQNSLHLRRNSWCCAALSGPEAAFHTSPSNSGSDACGYCGEEFSNPPQWDIRAEHLSVKHKFQECNQAKKFYRADHFRQHLKHSHSGTSGKWTNHLESACMQGEPPPEKRSDIGLGSAHGASNQAPPALMVATAGLSSMNNSAQNPLVETPLDS